MAFGRLLTANIGTTPVVVSATVSVGKTHTVHGMTIANTAAAPIAATATITDGTTTSVLAAGMTIPAHDSLGVMGMEFKHNLLPGDSVSVTSDTVSSLDVVYSYLEQ